MTECTTNVDFYENMALVRSANYKEIIRALNIVRKFVADRGFILVGGMAIDYALKLKGDRIYDDDELPDYDFYSPAHSTDAYELAAILCKENFENVSCISAAHITTMRVRVDYEPVADITFCPQVIYDQVPTLQYEDLRIAHPHWQMIDQHSSLSMPFENPGREVIFHRWKKDMVRYDKLYSHYPVTPSKIKQAKTTIPLNEIKGTCLCGWSRDVRDGKVTAFGDRISIATDDYLKCIDENKMQIVSYHSEYFGKLPRYVLCKSRSNVLVEVFDVAGKLISASQVDKKNNVWLCNVQWSMVYSLVRGRIGNSYVRYVEYTESGEMPSIEVYGKENFTHAYINAIKKMKERVYSISAPQMQPPNFHPRKNCAITKSFDHTTSEYFKTDGGEVDHFEPFQI